MAARKPAFGDDKDPKEVTKSKLKDWDREIPDKAGVIRGKVTRRRGR